jgi:hypothetical protein
MRHFNSIAERLAASVRFAAIATGAARFTQRVVAAIRHRGIAGTAGQMNDRELQDVGLSRLRVRATGDGFASAEAQLGMVR